MLLRMIKWLFGAKDETRYEFDGMSAPISEIEKDILGLPEGDMVMLDEIKANVDSIPKEEPAPKPRARPKSINVRDAVAQSEKAIRDAAKPRAPRKSRAKPKKVPTPIADQPVL